MFFYWHFFEKYEELKWVFTEWIIVRTDKPINKKQKKDENDTVIIHPFWNENLIKQ